MNVLKHSNYIVHKLQILWPYISSDNLPSLLPTVISPLLLHSHAQSHSCMHLFRHAGHASMVSPQIGMHWFKVEVGLEQAVLRKSLSLQHFHILPNPFAIHTLIQPYSMPMPTHDVAIIIQDHQDETAKLSASLKPYLLGQLCTHCLGLNSFHPIHLASWMKLFSILLLVRLHPPMISK